MSTNTVNQNDNTLNTKVEFGFPQQHNTNSRIRISRDEMNLAEFPLAVLSTRTNSNIKTLEFSDYSKTSTGELIERKWIITGADKFGLPTSTDDDVILGLIRLSMDQGFRERKIYFTRYELLKILQWSTEGKSYGRLIKSLDRLSGVRIRSSNSFYDNASKSYQTCNFGIIDAYEINNERSNKFSSKGEAPKSFFIWSEMLFDSFKAGFIKKLDLDIYFNLKSAVSRRLYRYLDKHFYYRQTLEMPLMMFAFEKVGLSRSYKYISSIKQQLQPAIEELTKIGFLSNVEYSGAGEQTIIRFTSGDGSHVNLKPKEKKELPCSTPQTQTRRTPEPQTFLKGFKGDPLVSELLKRGIAESQAKRLVEQKNESERAKVYDILTYYDQLKARNDKKVSISPVGFLYRAVENSYKFSLPNGFVSARTNRQAAKEGAIKPLHDTAKVTSDKLIAIEEAKKKRAEELIRLMDKEKLRQLSQSVKNKMTCLKGVLSEQGFNDALAGCIREEVLRQASI